MFINQFDFHYHAGNERNEGASLKDCFAHLRMTDRRAVGIVDHFGFFCREELQPAIYPRGKEGLAQFRREFDGASAAYPEICAFFGSEVNGIADIDMGSNMQMLDICRGLCDYLICEPNGFGTNVKNGTERFAAFIKLAADMRDYTGLPVFIAHPIRDTVNEYLRFHPDMRRVELAPKEDFREWSAGECADYFNIDFETVGSLAFRLDIPIEVNTGTVSRLIATNRPVTLQMYKRAYHLMRECGAELVPSSDLHKFEFGLGGSCVPYELMADIGVRAEDIRFHQRIRG